jgi:hypothetical protein
LRVTVARFNIPKTSSATKSGEDIARERGIDQHPSGPIRWGRTWATEKRYTPLCCENYPYV